MENKVGSVTPTATFRFKDIGPVKEAELELGDLTIIAGRNNTGKTYIAYTLYGFLKMWKDWWPYADDFLTGEKPSDARFPDINSIAEQLVQESRASFPLDESTLGKQRREITQKFSRTFSKEIFPSVFSSKDGDFERSSIDVDFGEINIKALRSTRSYSRETVFTLIKYDGTKVTFSLDKTKNTRPHTESILLDISNYYFLFLLDGIFPDPFILSAERFGISLFYRELDFTKNQLVDLLQKMGDDKNRERVPPYLFIDRATSRYALPIKDNIDYTRSIPDRRETKSELYENKLYDDIKNMMDGYYGTSDDEIRFISKARGEGRSFNIPLHLASSSARGLSDLYFFLRHVARKNHLLIIDEPESHLDTANQILLARLLARFVHAGLKILVTTHSDYLIKEINNLVMLNGSFSDKETVFKKFKYTVDDCLTPESIRAYVAEGNSLTKCEVDRFGIDMPVFDETIDDINRVANDLSSRLDEEEA